jgi:hypothetical protein
MMWNLSPSDVSKPESAVSDRYNMSVRQPNLGSGASPHLTSHERHEPVAEAERAGCLPTGQPERTESSKTASDVVEPFLHSGIGY